MLPTHYLVPFSRGVGNLPTGLWVAVLDPEVTTSPTRGVYVVYLFDENLRTVTLSLNQGVTNVRTEAHRARARARDLLRREAAGIRQLLGAELVDGLAVDIDLGSSSLLREYEAGNVAGRTYDLSAIPDDRELNADLIRFVDLYVASIQVVEAGLTTRNELVSVSPRQPDVIRTGVDVRFQPKNATEYLAHIRSQDQVRSRTHEDLVRRLGEWSRSRGFKPNTNVHPRDLVLHHPTDGDLLVEVKAFASGHPRESIRSAIGQLFEYDLFYPGDKTRLVAALSESPGDAYCALLTKLGIATVWPDKRIWVGTSLARDAGLVA